MGWEIKIEEKPKKFLKNLDKPIKIQIVNFINKLLESKNPRIFGRALTGNKSGL
jgi:mRNA-degrading endonuclease RelE of RelBE toxin-antitoxin system